MTTRFDDVTTGESIGGGLASVLEFLTSKEVVDKDAAEFAGLEVEQQVTKFNEAQKLKNSVSQVKRYEDLVISVTEHWMAANEIKDLTMPSLRKLQRLYDLCKRKHLLTWMGYEALLAPNFCDVFVTWMSNKKKLISQVTKMISYSCNLFSRADNVFESPNFKPIVQDYFSTKRVIIECLKSPADKGIHNPDDLQEILLDTLPKHQVFQNNLYKIRLWTHLATEPVFPLCFKEIGVFNCYRMYLERALSSVKKDWCHFRSSFLREQEFWMSYSCTDCGYSFELDELESILC